MFKLKTVLFLLFPLTLFSQSISGIVYDDKTTIKGAKVFNATLNTITYTNAKGHFEITARLNDTLVVGSLFHEEQRIFITKEYLKTNLIVELKKTINTLDEVLLENTPKEKPFVAEAYSATLNEQIQEDLKRTPEKYESLGSGSPDLIRIAKLVSRLFKKRERFIEEPIVTATYKDFETLFKTDYLINKELLINELKIDAKFHTLFFDFCHAQNIDSKLFDKDKQLLLIETLYKCSSDFQKILKEIIKD